MNKFNRGDKIIWINNGYSIGLFHSSNKSIGGYSLIKIGDSPVLVNTDELILHTKEKEKELESKFKPIPFKNGDKVKYEYGLTFTYVGLDPFDSEHGYFIHPSAVNMIDNHNTEQRIDRLPMDKITHE